MKVWITKYALTSGIIETEIIKSGPIYTVFENDLFLYTYDREKDWHTSYAGAKSRAEKMRQKKIASLKKQIEKLEGMKFE